MEKEFLRTRDIGTARWIIEYQKININCKDEYGRTKLHLAANNCDEEMVKLLVEKNADQFIRDNNGYVAARIISEFGIWMILKDSINEPDNNNQTVLNNVIKEGMHSFAKFLISLGAKVTTEDFIAATNVEFVKWFIDNGLVDKEQCEKKLKWAVDIGDLRVVEMIKDQLESNSS